MQELILVRNSLFLIFYEIWHETGYEIRHGNHYENKNWDKIMDVCPLVVKQILGRLQVLKPSQNLFYHQRTNIHDFIPIFVFVTVSVTDFVTDSVSDFVSDFVTDFVTDFVSDFVNKYFTSISYQIIYVLETFCLPNFQILNYNQLGHSTGIVGTCLGHIWYPQTLKRERNPHISVKLLLNSKRRIF